MFHLNAAAVPGRVPVNTFWLNPNTTTIDLQEHRVIGHNEAIQRGSRSPEGQALQLRVDFNTMDAMDGPAVFHQSRLAMDASELVQHAGLTPHDNGINAFLRVTRRQNFLVPPRAHRAFPLVELGA